jgi:hypothetical protein
VTLRYGAKELAGSVTGLILVDTLVHLRHSHNDSTPVDLSAQTLHLDVLYRGHVPEGPPMQGDLDYGVGSEYSAIGTSQHFRWLQGIVKWLLVLNLLDGIFTLVWVQYFYAEEYNLMLRDLAQGDMVLFMLVKLTLVSLGAIFLWRNRSHPLAVIAIFFAFLAYYLVLLYHLRYTTLILL